VTEAMSQDPNLTLNAASKRTGPKAGIVADTLRSSDRAGSG